MEYVIVQKKINEQTKLNILFFLKKNMRFFIYLLVFLNLGAYANTKALNIKEYRIYIDYTDINFTELQSIYADRVYSILEDYILFIKERTLSEQEQEFFKKKNYDAQIITEQKTISKLLELNALKELKDQEFSNNNAFKSLNQLESVDYKATITPERTSLIIVKNPIDAEIIVQYSVKILNNFSFISILIKNTVLKIEQTFNYNVPLKNFENINQELGSMLEFIFGRNLSSIKFIGDQGSDIYLNGVFVGQEGELLNYIDSGLYSASIQKEGFMNFEYALSLDKEYQEELFALKPLEEKSFTLTIEDGFNFYYQGIYSDEKEVLVKHFKGPFLNLIEYNNMFIPYVVSEAKDKKIILPATIENPIPLKEYRDSMYNSLGFFTLSIFATFLSQEWYKELYAVAYINSQKGIFNKELIDQQNLAYGIYLGSAGLTGLTGLWFFWDLFQYLRRSEYK